MMFNLILATFLSFVNVHSSLLGKQILKYVNKPLAIERELLDQKNALRLEQSEMSITDNFARYSRIQRKINLIDEELSNYRSKRNNISLQIGLTYGLKVLFGIILVILSIYYRNSPVFMLDEGMDLMPFSYFISYPNEKNSISFHFWVLCSSAVARLINI